VENKTANIELSKVDRWLAIDRNSVRINFAAFQNDDGMFMGN